VKFCAYCQPAVKGVFLLVADFWLYEARIWPGTTKGKTNLARRKKTKRISKVGWCITPIKNKRCR